MWSDLPKAINDIEYYGRFSNVSISIWWYREAEKKYFGKDNEHRFLRYGPKYSTALTDRVFFDIDCVDKDDVINREQVTAFHKMWEWTITQHFRRQVCFTGGGYQALICADINPSIYEGVYEDVRHRFGITGDEYATLEKMRRVPGSFNFGNGKKSKRDLYCISLTDEEALLPFEEVREIARNPRKDLIWTGDIYYEPTTVKITPKKRELDRNTHYTVEDDASKILAGYGWDYSDICPNIRAIIEQPRVGHYERMEVIKYLKSIVGLKYADCVLVLPKILTSAHNGSNDGYHSVEEGQPTSIYSRNIQFNSDQMIKRGYCDVGCTKCKKFIEASR